MSNSVVHYMCSISVAYGRLRSIMHPSDYMEKGGLVVESEN